ncbi:MAG TPA: ABC transporter ATP-binding protein [Anaerolineales bacterium]
MSDFAIEANELVKEFKVGKLAVRAVNGLSLQVGAGETYGLIGPDGAGKTTTTRVILGLLRRTAGASRILGYDSMREASSIRERVGYIAQQFALPAQLTVMENMYFFAGLQGVTSERQKKRIPELLAFAGLGDFTGRLAGRLSGGMKKKLALACSLIHEPQVVMLDEPTLGVDPVSRREFWNLLGNLQVEKGLTIFVCTPYMDEAERCTQVGLIYAGRLIAKGTPASIKASLPGHLVEFAPSPFVPARKLVSHMAGVLEVQSYGDKLRLFVDDVAIRMPQIEGALRGEGIRYEGMRQATASMEEAFISLVRKEERQVVE